MGRPQQSYLCSWSLDSVLKSHVAVAQVVGDFFERVVVQAIRGAQRGPRSGEAEICWDCSVGDRHYYEVKASGDGKFLLFRSQVEAYQKLIGREPGAEVFYAFINYKRAKVLSGGTKRSIVQYLGQQISQMIVLPFECVEGWIQSDWCTTGQGNNEEWNSRGDSTYYRVYSNRLRASIAANNGWMGKLGASPETYSVLQWQKAGGTIKVEAEDIAYIGFPVLELHRRAERSSGYQEGVPF